MSSRVIHCFLFGAVIALAACGSKSDDVRDSARESLGVNQEQTTITPAPVPPATLPASTPGALVHHYTCPNNCEGSGGPSAGTCPVCGTAWVHNQAYHDQPQQTTTTSTGTQKVTFPGTTAPAGGTPTQVPPPAPEPAQNAAGVWHYICSSGCEGGAGSAGPCPGCGATLTHNAVYHQ